MKREELKEIVTKTRKTKKIKSRRKKNNFIEPFLED